MPKKEVFDVEVELLHETEKAWYVTDGNKTEWIPKSMAQLDQEPNGTYTLSSSEWLLKEKGFL